MSRLLHFRQPTGLYIPDTWEAARRSGPRQLLDWYRRHCGHQGPVLGSTTGTGGTIGITSQADADALRGWYTKGNLYTVASDITIRNIWNEMDPATYVGPTCYLDTSCANLVFENCTFDGVYDIGSIGIGGDVSYNLNITFRYCEIKRCGFDSVRMFKNSRLEYCLIHDMREWVPGTDGTYDPNGDQNIYPHTDGVQMIRTGNTIYRCAIINNLSDQAVSSIIVKPDAGEDITSVVVDQCYLEGANNYTCHFVDGPNSLTGVVMRDCIFSKNFGGYGSHPSTPVSFGTLNPPAYTFTNNRWADDNTLISGLPLTMVQNGGFDSDLSGWSVGPNLTATWISGTASIARTGAITVTDSFKTIVQVTSGVTYTVSYTISGASGARQINNSGGTVFSGFGPAAKGTGTFSENITPNASEMHINFWPTNSGETIVLDNVSVVPA